ncbi:MAG: ATP-grasp domain-containing protein, partial [Dehalococcoidales bacterium]|nr:ATP-grasp domain-containing protein [Dehalococcoidales bacterium]
MAMNLLPSGISVLLLFNLDPSWLPEERKQALDVTLQLKQAMSGIGYRTVLVPITDQNLDSVLSGYDPLEHIVFNWCESLPGVPHGEWFVAEYLEQRGFTFTGAGSDIITLSQNKHLIKQLLEESGIPTPAWQMYNSKSPVRWGRFPAIVKPAREHCSEGIDRNAIVMTEAELKSRVAYILEKFGQPVLVEDFIDGRELHVSLWGNGDVCMLPPAEMEFSSLRDAHDRICSYEAKFVPDSEQYQKIETVLPAKLSEDELYEVEQVCKKAYMVTGCRDYARIDMRIKDGLLYVIDINPNSDISPDTTTIAAAELAGYTYGEFG